VLPQWGSDTNTDVAGNKGQQFPALAGPPVAICSVSGVSSRAQVGVYP